jgi:hypothetical protein
LFILGVFGAVYSKRLLSIIISLQLIVVSALINFYSFGLFVYQSSSWDKTFILLSFITIYLLFFSVVFYSYSRQAGIYDFDVKKDMRLFKFTKSDWWGEEKVDDN